MRNIKLLTICFILLCSSVLLISCESDETTIIDPEENLDTLSVPFLASDFDVAESCQGCHPQHYDEWSGSMHAYSVKDPSWLAIREVGQSQYVNALDGACSPCHTPIGLRSGDLTWGPLTIDELDPVTQEGIGCDACHTITGITRLSNGGFDLAPSDVKHGTIRNPIETSAHKSQYNDLYASSEYCGSCHDFVTDDGLPLEVVFQEWRASGFALTGKTCNDCHMEEYTGPAFVGGPDRTLHRHDFIGADVAMIDFPNKPEQLVKVTAMLQNALSITLIASDRIRAGDTYSFDVSITNDKTGHNVPSGVPFNRQMWLSIIIKNADDSVVFSSGQLDANDDLMDRYSEFLERDTFLFNAQATMLKADGSDAAVWDVDSLVNPSIKPGETKTVSYSFIPDDIGFVETFTIEVKLRFRSFAPHLFRELGLDSLLPIPIIDMNSVNYNFIVFN